MQWANCEIRRFDNRYLLMAINTNAKSGTGANLSMRCIDYITTSAEYKLLPKIIQIDIVSFIGTYDLLFSGAGELLNVKITMLLFSLLIQKIFFFSLYY